MGFKSYFTGKSGVIFWVNILLMVIVLISIPVGGLQILDNITHHGEKIPVPNTIGKNAFEAEIMLREKGLQATISDSVYNKLEKPGVILAQTPHAGKEVKSGRIIYLTMNLSSEPLVKLPDLANNCSRREAEAQLKSMGFRLAPTKYVEGYPKDLVISLNQGNRKLYAGDMVSKERAITLTVGAGDPKEDTIYTDDTEDFDIGDISSDESEEIDVIF